MGDIVQAVVVGMLVLLAGTIPRNLLFAANLRYFTAVPWAVPLTAVYVWLFWRYLNGAGPPESTAAERRTSLRANRLPALVWAWALLAGALGIVALVLALRVANRIVVLPQQPVPDLSQVPKLTVLALLLMAAPVAGIVEESAFRGYMQGPIERRFGLPVAILITGTMFAVAHLDFTLILWPYYVAVAAIYGTVTYLTPVDSARRGAAHERQHLFEHHAVADGSGGMAGLVRPCRPDLDDRRRCVVLDRGQCMPDRLGGDGVGLRSARSCCPEGVTVELDNRVIW